MRAATGTFGTEGVRVSRPKGFVVDPDKLAAFQAEVKPIAEAYTSIVGQLDEARLTDKMGILLGRPDELGSSGPPVDFTSSSETMLGNLDTLLGMLRDVHAAVGAQFEYMSTQLEETHGLYSRMDGEHARVFENLLGDRPSDGS